MSIARQIGHCLRVPLCHLHLPAVVPKMKHNKRTSTASLSLGVHATCVAVRVEGILVCSVDQLDSEFQEHGNTHLGPQTTHEARFLR